MWVDKINKKFFIILGLVLAVFIILFLGYEALKSLDNNKLSKFSNSAFSLNLPLGFSRIPRSGSFLFAEKETESIPNDSIEISYKERDETRDTVDKVLESATTNFFEDSSTPQPKPIKTDINGREAGKIVREGEDYENQSTTYYIFETDTVWRIKFRYENNASIVRTDMDEIINSFTPK